MGPLTALAVALAGLIGWQEVGRLVSGAVSPERVSYSLDGFLLADRWELWGGATTSDTDAIARGILVASACDVAFFVGYFFLVRWWIGSTAPVATTALRWLVWVEIAESVLLATAAVFLWTGDVPWFIWGPLVVLGGAKWLALLVVVVAALRSPEFRSRTWSGTRRTFDALRVQRLSLVIVVLLGVLALVPAGNLHDQLPDVVRAWFDVDRGWAVWHLVVGLLSFLIGGLALFFLGRQRSERSWITRVGQDGVRRTPTKHAEYRWWLAGPVIAVLIAVGLAWLGPVGSVDPRVLALFVGVPAVLVFVSWLIRRAHVAKERKEEQVDRACRRDVELWSQKPPPVEDRRGALDVWLVGDLLAVAVPMIGALALVRALVAPVVVNIAAPGVLWQVRLALLAAALAVIVLGPRGADWLAARPQPAGAGTTGSLAAFLRPDQPPPNDDLLYRRVPQLFWGSAIVFLLSLVVFPLQAGQFLGVVATAVLALVAWALFLGLLIVHLQYQRPLEVFRWLRMRANPILSLFLLVPAVASLWGGVVGLHALRTPPDPVALPDRPTIAEWFDTWVEAGADCRYAVGRGAEDGAIRPLVLVAASGGGIRAATWTSGVMHALDQAGDCAAPAVFLSSGVSGGSLGLVLGREEDPDVDPTDDVAELAHPDALSGAVAGLLVGDLVAGSSGLKIPSIAHGDAQWRDRAGLMETVWEEDATVLGEPFDATPRGSGGMLVLNSTSTNSGCRVLVSQLDLVPGVDGRDQEDVECVRAEDDLPASVDLQDLYGPCTPGMTWATAAMLSARFATVTPSGRVPADERELPGGLSVDCSAAEEMQLIDGGYAETSGIGTLADLAPAIMREVVAYNVTRGSAPPVVPVVLYLEDEPRTDIARDPGGLTPELLVPMEGGGATGLQAGTTTLLQRVAAAFSAPCGTSEDGPAPEAGAVQDGAPSPAPDGAPPDPAAVEAASRDAVCVGVTEAVHAELSGGVVVAAPLTAPAVEAPLGWTLSPDSRTRMSADVREQIQDCDDNPRPGGYACLRPLLDVLRGDRQPAGGATN
ncbi:MAG TPA: hypothetical protein VGB58_10175 [Blastococcus sp.]